MSTSEDGFRHIGQISFPSSLSVGGIFVVVLSVQYIDGCESWGQTRR